MAKEVNRLLFRRSMLIAKHQAHWDQMQTPITTRGVESWRLQPRGGSIPPRKTAHYFGFTLEYNGSAYQPILSFMDNRYLPIPNQNIQKCRRRLLVNLFRSFPGQSRREWLPYSIQITGLAQFHVGRNCRNHLHGIPIRSSRRYIQHGLKQHGGRT